MDINQIIKYDNEQLIKVGNAIAVTNKLLALGEKFYAVEYNNRGIVKYKANNYLEAIEDYNKAIEIDPTYAYINRGNVKEGLNDYLGAIEDYNIAIEINPKYANAYYNRAISKQKIDDSTCCKDWKIAVELGVEDASEMLKKYCNV